MAVQIKQRRVRKPWWNEGLSAVRNEMCIKEREWIREKNNIQKQRLKMKNQITFRIKINVNFGRKLGSLGLQMKDNHLFHCNSKVTMGLLQTIF